MASPAQDVASGITIVFGTSGFAALLKNTSVSERGVNDVETTHQTSAVGATHTTLRIRTYVPGDFLENGEFTAEYYFDPDLTPPFGIVQTVTVTWPSGCTWAGSGYLRNAGGDAITIDEAMMITGTIKWAGDITVTTGA